ncbi:Hypothetical predicted protein [Mytilus galloprovincialis]|uniref:Novel STAND NTPase 3 domain-containing protein n=1 Tax=Mytilus galloprovincialis TaxID=29158 RepID=A0A8B6CXY1_MYTGA|nr:Hypothetical predicted protein [Mytilus galloprovincialis]
MGRNLFKDATILHNKTVNDPYHTILTRKLCIDDQITWYLELIDSSVNFKGSERHSALKVMVTGSSGCGKSFNIHHVALHLRNKYGYEVVPVLTGPSDIINYKHERTQQVFVVDDICGKETINIHTLQMWRDYSETMEKIFQTIKTEESNQNNDNVSNISRSKLLISCRLHIYRESQFQLNNFLTRKECNVLSPELCLLQEEKIQMAKIYRLGHMIDKVMKIEGNIDFFPLLCKLSKDIKSEEVLNLFTAPVDSIKKTIKHIVLESDMQCCALVLCVLYYDGFDTDWLKLKSILETEKRNKIEDIVKEFDIDLSKEKSRKTLKLCFDTLDGTYLRRRGTYYRMIHDMIHKLAVIICGQKLTECFIKHVSSVFIRDYFIFKSVTDAPVNDDVIMLSGDEEEVYFQRLLNDLNRLIITSTFHNKQLKYKPFREKLIRKFGGSDEAKRILKSFDPKDNKIETGESFSYYYFRTTTPLTEAVEFGYYELVHFLVETVKCDLNVGRPQLYMASRAGKTDIVQLLLQNNINRFNCKIAGSCSLYVACEKGHTDIVKLLLPNNAHVSQCPSFRSFVMECVQGHAYEDVNTMHDHACEYANTMRDHAFKYVNTMHDRAYEYVNTMHDHDCSCIVRSGQLRQSPCQSLRDRESLCNCRQTRESLCNYRQTRESPLHVACKGGYIKIVTLLLQVDSDVFVRNRLGETPLYTACDGGHQDIVELLLQNKAGIYQCNSDGESPLYMACANGHTNIVEILLQNNADVSQCKNDGESPLYIACSNGHTDIVKILLQNNADVSQSKINGETPCQAASANEHTDIVNILLQNEAGAS